MQFAFVKLCCFLGHFAKSIKDPGTQATAAPIFSCLLDRQQSWRCRRIKLQICGSRLTSCTSITSKQRRTRANWKYEKDWKVRLFIFRTTNRLKRIVAFRICSSVSLSCASRAEILQRPHECHFLRELKMDYRFFCVKSCQSL